jgi:outer membrane protein insertion porin family
VILKAYLTYPFTIIIFFAFITLGCRSTKRLNKNEALVTKLTLNGVDNRFSEPAKGYVSLDLRPNSRFNLWVYNTFNKKGKNKLGEAPRILDSSLVEISRIQVESYLKIKGFRNAKVTSEIKVANKKAEIIYNAIPGTEFKFRNITFDIPDSTIKSIYLNNRQSFTRIDSGARYDTDSIAYEREKIYVLMKQNGYYDYIRQYMQPVVDTNFNKGVADVKIVINNPPFGGKHQIYTIDNTLVRIQPSSGIILDDMLPDSAVVDSQYRFYDYSKFFKSNKIARFLFLKKGDQYNIDNGSLTTQRLFDLNVFKSINVDYRKLDDSTKRLTGLVDIIPLKKKNNRFDGEYTFNPSITGFNLGVTYQNKNIFGGAELFEIKVRGGLQFDKNKGGNLTDRLLSRDYQVGVSLTFPELIVPFNIPILGKNGIPRTRIGTSYQTYKLTDIYLRRSFGTTLTYEWVETKYKIHSLTPVNIQFSQGDISSALKQQLINQQNAFFLTTLNDQLISSSYYNYSLNLAKLNSQSNFTFFSGTAEVGGNTASLFGKRNAATPEFKSILGVPYYQFVKLETDVRFYKSFGNEKQFIARFNPGIGYSYGNIASMPFDKQFFAGGSSGVRAWQARTLGPGNYNRRSLDSSSTRINLRNLDQIGDIKFEGNLEYRFKILNNFIGTKLKGAAFVDFGNIWKLNDDGFKGSQIKLNKLFNQTAIGTGVGLRFDIDFFVFRLDIGYKFKDPQFEGLDGETQYVYQYWFDRTRRKDAERRYSLSNGPDSYRIKQIQFGIGMPF